MVNKQRDLKQTPNKLKVSQNLSKKNLIAEYCMYRPHRIHECYICSVCKVVYTIRKIERKKLGRKPEAENHKQKNKIEIQ